MSISHLSELIQKQIKVADNKINDLEWKTIKRSPQYFKQKARLGTNTYDPEFDELREKFDDTEKAFQKIIEEMAILKTQTVELMKISESIGMTAKLLLEPDSDDFQYTYQVWQNASFYTEVMKLMAADIQKEYTSIASLVHTKAGHILTIMKTIKRRIQSRNFALLDYDLVFNQYEALLVKQTKRPLTVKESPLLHNLERKSDAARNKYRELNAFSKTGLIQFFGLVEEAIEPLQLAIICTQWMAGYRMINEGLEQVYRGEIREAASTIIGLPILEQDGCKKSGVSNVARTNLDSNVVGPRMREHYCKAIFSFKAEQPGDLELRHGDVIRILDSNGNWWMGEIDGRRGMFPSNYVEYK